MKKYIIKFAIFAAVVVLVDFFAGLALDAIQHKAFEKNPLRFEVRAMYAIEQAESEVDIIGASDASHSYISNMIADSLGLTAFNYGKDGCFFVYQNCLINLMLEHHTPKVILWEIGKGSLATSETNEDREWQSIKDFYPYYHKSDYCKTLIDSRNKFQKAYMLSGLYRHNSNLLSIIEPFLSNETIDDSNKGYLPIANEGYLYPKFIDKALDYDNVNSWKADLLKGTLDFCREKDVKVVFCFSPKYQNEYVEQTSQWQAMKAVIDEYDIPVIDYYNDTLFISDSTLFKDNRHLNDRGARLYMEHFVPELKQILTKQ